MCIKREKETKKYENEKEKESWKYEKETKRKWEAGRKRKSRGLVIPLAFCVVDCTCYNIAESRQYEILMDLGSSPWEDCIRESDMIMGAELTISSNQAH